ncbi:hypothetical protein LPB19_08560 [Marinobacter salinisoli]|uniref:Uncharacterized protein n=1 Tax=Marinobacter salinisoli TaxID=2769486 RepID=A0ABX7MPI9_9GAMM|nr:hypothetical protein [Marinobacter salinisoli]QSP93290.1 hypothetical protein LPB19_08560 [Marinobacter salinisoli]
MRKNQFDVGSLLDNHRKVFLPSINSIPEKIVYLAAVVIFSFASFYHPNGRACALEAPLGLDAFSVSHKGVISVAIATREAVERNILSGLPQHEVARRWVLTKISHRAAAHMSALSKQAASGPTISVLLTQTGAWMRLNDPTNGAEYHTSRPSEDELTVLIPDLAYAELLDGKLTIEDLLKLKLLKLYGNSENSEAEALEVFRSAFQQRS